ncbi:MAG: HIT domain-containing protein [Bdellovibrionaceae bacterium]|nr:HIT domain-containing protein [Pseudobdellovibrionaceae bacterium]
MGTCVFCRILQRQEPASFVYRDDKVAAFMDIQPQSPGHLLIVPVSHFERLPEIPLETASAMFSLAVRISRSIAKGPLQSQGHRLVLSDGACAGQEVPHVHLHIIPKWFDKKQIPQKFCGRQRDTLDLVAESIQNLL